MACVVALEAFWCFKVVSDCNLQDFLAWYDHAEEWQKEVAREQLYVMEHRMLAIGIRTDHLPLREVPCYDVGCQRCDQLRGGYRFGWVSRLWSNPVYLPPLASTADHGRFLRSWIGRPQMLADEGLWCHEAEYLRAQMKWYDWRAELGEQPPEIQGLEFLDPEFTRLVLYRNWVFPTFSEARSMTAAYFRTCFAEALSDLRRVTPLEVD